MIVTSCTDILEICFIKTHNTLCVGRCWMSCTLDHSTRVTWSDVNTLKLRPRRFIFVKDYRQEYRTCWWQKGCCIHSCVCLTVLFHLFIFEIIFFLCVWKRKYDMTSFQCLCLSRSLFSRYRVYFYSFPRSLPRAMLRPGWLMSWRVTGQWCLKRARSRLLSPHFFECRFGNRPTITQYLRRQLPRQHCANRSDRIFLRRWKKNDSFIFIIFCLCLVFLFLDFSSWRQILG